MRARPWSAVLAAAAAAAACAPDTSTRTHGLEAFCDAPIEMPGGPVTVDVETDYLPRVVTCENGAAAPAALEAQAIAARSYLYYRLERTGSIGDGTGDQVYTCGREPDVQHTEAVARTSGLVLRYPEAEATQVAAFYVAGARQVGPDCVGGTDDPTGTEQWVTYNEGLSGDAIVQTPLGFVSPDNHANRGCMSQNGADCLADAGREVGSILRFYYGEDIVVAQADGPCVTPVELPDLPDAGPGAPGGASSGCQSGGAAGAVALAFVVGAWGLAVPRGRRKVKRRRR